MRPKRLALFVRSSLLHLAPVALAAPLAAPLTAQTSDSLRDSVPVMLAPLEAEASIAPAAGQRVGSGVPARITVVSGEELDLLEPRLLSDALANQPGFSLYDDLGSPYKLSLVTRGFSAGPVLGLPQGVSVFVDGVRQNEPDAAQVNFDLLPLEHVQRVEFLHGTGSLLGPNSLGGAVNLVTRRGSGRPRGGLELSAGSSGLASLEGALGGEHDGWDLYVGAGAERDDGWREQTGARGGNVFLNAGREEADRGLRLQTFWSTSRVETAGSLPEELYVTDPRRNFTAGDFEDLSQWQGSLSGHLRVGAGIASLTVYHRRTDAERFNVNQAPDPDVRSRTANRSVGLLADWRRELRVGMHTVAVRAGVDGAANRVGVEIFTEAPGDTTLTTSVRSPSWDLSGYALADLRLGALTLSGGVRYDYIRVPFEDRLDPAADTTSTFRRLSPRGGASLALGENAALYASVGGSFRAPALVELTCADEAAPCPLPFALGDDPPLDPVVATTVETGGRWSVGDILFTGSAYRTAVRDDIFFIASDAALFEGHFDNIGDTRREGVELEARWFPGPLATIYVNYAWSRATFRTSAALFSPREEADPASGIAGENEVEPGDEFPMVPNHQVRTGAALAFPGGVDASLDIRYTGGQWLRGDEANETSRLPGYTLADVRLAWSRGGWEVSAIVSNLFDAGYAAFGTFNENRLTGEIERFLTPGLPRRVRLRLARAFAGGIAGD